MVLAMGPNTLHWHRRHLQQNPTARWLLSANSSQIFGRDLKKKKKKMPNSISLMPRVRTVVLTPSDFNCKLITASLIPRIHKLRQLWRIVDTSLTKCTKIIRHERNNNSSFKLSPSAQLHACTSSTVKHHCTANIWNATLQSLCTYFVTEKFLRLDLNFFAASNEQGKVKFAQNRFERRTGKSCTCWTEFDCSWALVVQ